MRSLEERVGELEATTARRLEAIEHKLRMLISCVAYDPESHYTAEALKGNFYGDRLTALNLVISALLSRALGSPHRMPEHFPDGDVAWETVFARGRVDRQQAVSILAMAFSIDASVAERLLAAHKAAGRGLAGHDALGT